MGLASPALEGFQKGPAKEPLYSALVPSDRGPGSPVIVQGMEANRTAGKLPRSRLGTSPEVCRECCHFLRQGSRNRWARPESVRREDDVANSDYRPEWEGPESHYALCWSFVTNTFVFLLFSTGGEAAPFYNFFYFFLFLFNNVYLSKKHIYCDKKTHLLRQKNTFTATKKHIYCEDKGGHVKGKRMYQDRGSGWANVEKTHILRKKTHRVDICVFRWYCFFRYWEKKKVGEK